MAKLIEIKGTIIGAESVVEKLSAVFPANAMENVRMTVRALGLELQRRVQLTKLAGQVLNRRTGALARSINTQFTSTATSETASVGTSKSYGRIWELTGTRAFTIVPVAKQALFWKGAAHPVKKVFHPAVAAKSFLKPTLLEMQPLIRESLETAMHFGL